MSWESHPARKDVNLAVSGAEGLGCGSSTQAGTWQAGRAEEKFRPEMPAADSNAQTRTRVLRSSAT
jgi:hypothetical protein